MMYNQQPQQQYVQQKPKKSGGNQGCLGVCLATLYVNLPSLEMRILTIVIAAAVSWPRKVANAALNAVNVAWKCDVRKSLLLAIAIKHHLTSIHSD